MRSLGRFAEHPFGPLLAARPAFSGFCTPPWGRTLSAINRRPPGRTGTLWSCSAPPFLPISLARVFGRLRSSCPYGHSPPTGLFVLCSGRGWSTGRSPRPTASSSSWPSPPPHWFVFRGGTAPERCYPCAPPPLFSALRRAPVRRCPLPVRRWARAHCSLSSLL